jgi:hypothetical protein
MKKQWEITFEPELECEMPEQARVPAEDAAFVLHGVP